ncbi:MAG: alpha/beta fold hydrolase [Myxococcota bacterium]|nr:alpha/beta fold hydrolase [Myxococcota bacterium]
MKLDTGELTLAYEDTGRGPPVLFIHGYPLGRRMWRPQLEALIGNMHVIAPDLRGHGDSDAVPGPYTIDMHADDCIDLLDGLEVDEPVVVCGLSMGGYVALALHRLYPERVAGLVLCATRATPDNDEAKAKRTQAMTQARDGGVSAIVDTMLPKLFAPQNLEPKQAVVKYVDQVMRKTSLEGLLGDLVALRDRPDARPGLAAIEVPTLVIHGKDDQLIPVSEAEALTAGIRGARLVTLENTGHLPNLEQPQLFNAALRDFVKLFDAADDDETTAH